MHSNITVNTHEGIQIPMKVERAKKYNIESKKGKKQTKEHKQKNSEANKGEKNGNAKFTPTDIIEIIKLNNTLKYTYQDLANKFKTTKSYIGNILNRNVWEHFTKNMTILKRTKRTHTKPVKGEKHSQSKLTEKQIFQIKYHDTRLHIRGGMYQIANEYNVSYHTIYDIKHEITWKHI